MPTFRLKSDGREYSTERPTEVTRLRLSRQYEEVGVEAPPTVKDTQFHPGEHKVTDVQKYIVDHPEDAARVIAEEKAGQARTTVIGE